MESSFIKSFSALIFLFVFSFAEAEAQDCLAHANWTFDPPPVNGQLELGATVEVCVDLVLYAPGGGAWLSGLELDFPPAWELSTLNVVSIPEPCSAGDGEWVYLDTLACAPYFFGPGFYFDRNSDGNFCNNFGDACAITPENMTFCFDITLAGDCPSDEENLFPYIRIVSDDYFGDFPSPCPNPIYVQPDLDNLSLNCCGVSSGNSPGTVALCESQCLFDLLEGAYPEGVWAGPAGYTDVLGCGYFDVNVDVSGDYTYTVEGGMCLQSSTITVIDTDLGVVGEVFTCSGEYGYLNEAIADEYPDDGTWYNPAGEVVVDGIAEFAVDGLGIYEYQFLSETGCLRTLGVEAFVTQTSGMPVSTVICENSGTFCPFDVFQSLQPPGIEVTEGGNWIVYDDAGNFLDFLPSSDMCLDYAAMQGYGASQLYFNYLLGSTECGISLDTLTVTVGEYSEGVTGTACAGIIDLEPYLPPGTPTGGFWTNYVEDWESVFDCTPCAVGSVHSFLYTYDLESGCTSSVGVELVITSSGDGDNYTVVECGDGSVLDLATLLPDDTDSGGVFSPSQEVVLLPQNSGTYTYTTDFANCGEAVYSFNLDIGDSLNYTGLTTTLSDDGNEYTVVFAITGGLAPYSINGVSVIGNDFTSSLIPVGTSYMFTLSDAGPCNDFSVSGGYLPTCTVSAGESPGEMDHCQPEPFCLFNELANADTGGVWAGPPGWVDAGCGLVDPSSSPPGDYYYIVSDGNQCADTAVISLVPIELGILYGLTSCTDDGVNLYEWYEATEDRFWMGPGYPQVLDTITDQYLNPDQYAPGIYTYVYYEEGCLTTVETFVNFNNAYSGNTDVEPVTICIDEMNFRPAEALGITDPYVGGNWILYDSTGTVFLDYFPYGDINFTGEYLHSFGSSVVLKYIQGAPPCDPILIDLYVFISVGNTQQIEDTVCQSDGSVDLNIYLPSFPFPGGVWVDVSGNSIPYLIDLSLFEPGSVQIFYYYNLLETGCTDIVEVWLTISESMGAGDDYDIILCGTGEMIDLYDLLPDDVDQNGIFPISQILAIPSNSGTYDYFLPIPSCNDQSAVYTLTFTEPFTSGVEAECNPGGTSFNAILEIAGGMPPYTVNGEAVEGTVYEASDLAVADGEVVFVVADAGLCDAIEMTIGVDDTDGDGVCDDQEITGCMDPAATNYDPNATDPGNCWFEIGGLEAPLTEWDEETGGEKPGLDRNSVTGSSPDQDLAMLIFPNPANGEVNLDIRGLASSEAVVEISDILGSIRYRSGLASADGEVLKKIDLSGYASGVYLIRLIDGEESLVSKVVVVGR
ncbi:T9SS type A sorting domain-containing protein [Cryomorpha ignava]|uniref:T9SS type A sorting domain-containing protein n=1 Tax=Cryomorpha ignava TaxID=101383 RepID=A0A7K3WRH7_9FLAO|nr:T9SS type A sorting domain-containing protein [Cryomorpha ignava]NEN23442.1 T9SS type A sorting domain-containing protein [Cryomorpha ignava]